MEGVEHLRQNMASQSIAQAGATEPSDATHGDLAPHSFDLPISR